MHRKLDDARVNIRSPLNDSPDDKKRARGMLRILFKASHPEHRRAMLEEMANRGDCDAILKYVEKCIEGRYGYSDSPWESLYEDILWVYRGGPASFSDE